MSSKSLQLQIHDFLEHLMTCSINSTKFSRAEAQTGPYYLNSLINWFYLAYVVLFMCDIYIRGFL
jgi:hypothetical protein